MNRVWVDALVAVLIAAAETLIEVVKRPKRKGKPAS
jgi:hypothetical protein